MRSITLLILFLVVLTVACPGARSFTATDSVTIPADGNLVLMNLTVRQVYPADDAGSIRYFITLDDSSAQDRFDVLLLTEEEYQNYASGLPFDYVVGASSIAAGAAPAMVYDLFDAVGNYVLILDNSNLAGIPSTSAELTVHYEVFLDNVDVQKESQWGLFIALMVIIILIGAVFLLALRVTMRHRLEKASEELDRKCPHCGRMMAPFGEYCPHCGGKR
ncbi:MAG: zinc ribbon domain-containing protein [Methanomassiliicoccales archaeon]|nr:zinc ribbon domain-containing protein [Methanomassiliicoccales archaeon]